MTPYYEAAAAIAKGEAKGHPLWLLISHPMDRDGHALKPMPWEGAGEYQHVTFADGRDGLIRIRDDQRALPIP